MKDASGLVVTAQNLIRCQGSAGSVSSGLMFNGLAQHSAMLSAFGKQKANIRPEGWFVVLSLAVTVSVFRKNAQ
jgi:hypothetical protein